MTYVTTNATLSWRYLLSNPSSLLPLPLDESLGIRAILDPELVTDLACRSLSFLILYWESNMLFEPMWVMTVNKRSINLFPLFLFE